MKSQDTSRSRSKNGDTEDIVDTSVIPMFSIVMPAYNIKKYISDAVCSIQNQTNGDFECIIVDDGSTDDGVAAITDLIAGDQRFVVRKQKNGGLSNARNNGFKLARGEYVLFLDGDDLFEIDLLAKVAANIRQTNSDIVIFNHTVLDDITGHKSQAVHDFASLRGRDTFTAKSISDTAFNTFGNQVWTKAFRRSLLIASDMTFDETLKRAEDIPFTNGALLCADSISIVDEALVAYRVNRGDSNSDRLAAHYKDIFTSLGKLYDLLDNTDQLSLFHASFQNLFMENVHYNLDALIGTDRFDDEFKLARTYAEQYQLSDDSSTYQRKQLADVASIIRTCNAFDMLTYITVNYKQDLLKKQTALYAKDDVISQREMTITTLEKQHNELKGHYEAALLRYETLANYPLIRYPLAIRRRVRKVIDKE